MKVDRLKRLALPFVDTRREILLFSIAFIINLLFIVIILCTRAYHSAKINPLPPEISIGIAIFIFILLIFTLPFCYIAFIMRDALRRPLIIFFRPFQYDRQANEVYKRLYRLFRSKTPDRFAAVICPGSRIGRNLRNVLFLSPIHALIRNVRNFSYLSSGSDWLSRVWRLLGDSRCAIFFLPSLTEFVALEVQLVLVCLGPERTLFVTPSYVKQSQVLDWIENIEGLLEFDQTKLKIITYDPENYVSNFDDAAIDFICSTPKRSKGISSNGLLLVKDFMPSQYDRLSYFIRTKIFFPAMVLSTILPILRPLFPD